MRSAYTSHWNTWPVFNALLTVQDLWETSWKSSWQRTEEMEEKPAGHKQQSSGAFLAQTRAALQRAGQRQLIGHHKEVPNRCLLKLHALHYSLGTQRCLELYREKVGFWVSRSNCQNMDNRGKPWKRCCPQSLYLYFFRGEIWN